MSDIRQKSSRGTLLPCLNRIDFYRLTEGELISALAEAISGFREGNRNGKLTDDHPAVCAWARLSIDVPNGGFTQFFFNHGGEVGIESAADLFEALELTKAGALLRDAVAIYRAHRRAFAVDTPWDGLFGSIKEFDKLDRGFEGVRTKCDRAMEKWIRSNIAELANDELGRPIDPQFTGSVEIAQPNGAVGTYLEVKKGKPNGAYREFFEDGTIRKVIFYKSGKVSGDFWPDGTLMRKESKRGTLTVIEWFYPSGLLQKRYVKDKTGYAVEPVCLFHENGQLAEQINRKKDKSVGPWLKFFEDGSPKLKAEYGTDEKLIVHDAWEDDGRQVVKDGKGVFRDDGRTIHWEYEVFFEHMWQHEGELKNGIPHGRTTRYADGIVWDISHYANGIQEGETTLYWNNGRVREVTKFARGKAGKSKSFPKFDRPVPAVVLTVKADEKLYAAWDHLRVDEYPRVLNLEDVQRRLELPDFLREVHERNLIGAIQSEYEDCSTFDDGIAYFLSVDESGAVIDAVANGSGVYSGGCWGIYPPLLRDLKFAPGRIRGKAVACRVLAEVDHTFVEGKSG